jgi:hypothetical protein
MRWNKGGDRRPQDICDVGTEQEEKEVRRVYEVSRICLYIHDFFSEIENRKSPFPKRLRHRKRNLLPQMETTTSSTSELTKKTTIMMFLTIIQVSYQNVFDQLFADADDGLLQVGNVSPPTRPIASHISTSDKRPVLGDVTNRRSNFASGLS